MYLIEDLLKEPPKLHDGGTVSWQMDDEVLEYLNKLLKQGVQTLETGAGVSTILFAMKKHSTFVLCQIRNWLIGLNLIVKSITFPVQISNLFCMVLKKCCQI